jgi:hypothetical protein
VDANGDATLAMPAGSSLTVVTTRNGREA